MVAPGTDKDNITYQNLGMKLRHEGNYFPQVKQTERQTFRKKG